MTLALLAAGACGSDDNDNNSSASSSPNSAPSSAESPGADSTTSSGQQTPADSTVSSANESAPATDGQTTDPPAAQRGGRLVVAVTAESEGFDPALSNLSSPGLSVATAIFDPLMVANEDGEVVPYLAESMEPNDDYTTWTMTLRQDVTFHDGTPLDAEAIRLNIEHHLQSPSGVAYAGLTGVTVIDDLTVTFDLDQTWVPFPAYLTTSLGLVAAPSMLADPEGAAHPVGTGPFVFEEWIPNQRFVGVRNPDYWQEDLPYLDEIEFRPITEFQSALNALQTGEVDVVQAYGGDALSAVRDAGDGIQVEVVDEGAFLENFVLLNNAIPPFDNIHARRALSFALDRDQLNDVLERGLAEPATGPFSGQDEYPIPENFPGYDLEQAEAEVAAYREETSEDLSFELSAASTGPELQEAQLLQDMWSRVGIDVEIRQVEDSQFILGLLQGDFQAGTLAFDGFLDPDQQTIFWGSAAAAPIGDFATNFGRFVNADLDALLAEARRTPDVAERRALYADVAQIIVDEVPWVYESRQISLVAAAADVGGLNTFPLPDGGDGIEYVQGIVRVGSLSQSGS
jgi:ABC-type transport system substrate-binding protein